jgi:hypothetical protein
MCHWMWNVRRKPKHRGKTPNSKHQTPEKLQEPNFKHQIERGSWILKFGASLALRAWSLVLLWSLEFGVWSFISCVPFLGIIVPEGLAGLNKVVTGNEIPRFGKRWRSKTSRNRHPE